MKTRPDILPMVLALLAGITQAVGQVSAFTYQGRLNDGASPANGLFDCSFSVWSAASGPAQMGPTLIANALVVANGLFTVTLDFGPGVFTGEARWLEIGVRTNGGGVSATAFVTTSDRNAKENFAPVNVGEVLARVAALPIARWNFRDLHDGQHMGPTAQDFHAAFGLGGSDTTITTLDADGVALAAIQGLNQKVESETSALRQELKRRDAVNAELRQELAELKRLVNSLVK